MRYPDRPATAGSDRTGVALATIIGIAAIDNVVLHLWLPEVWHLAARLCTVGLVCLVAVRIGGCGSADLGLARSTWGRGLRWGLVCMAVVAAGLALAPLLPGADTALEDQRVAELSTAQVWWRVLVAVPLGVAAAEELVFRGALLGLGRRRWSTWSAVALSSVLFGLWHVLSATELHQANPGAVELSASVPAAQWIGVGLAVVVTTALGVGLCWLRLASGSLLAPILAHTATNSFGYVAAWLAT